MAPFGETTSGAEIVAAFPEQIEGKTFVITGPSANSLGAQTAKFLAVARPAQLLLLGRTESKISPVINVMKEVSPDIAIHFVQIDLSNFNSIRKAAAEVNGLVTKIDVLINNAGIMALKEYTSTSEGLEAQFGANHIGHFLLTNLLAPKLFAASDGRVVNVSSDGFALGGVQFDNYNFDNGKTYDKWKAYGQSKTANQLFTISLASKLGSKGVLAYSVHPGKIQTNLGTNVDPSEWPKVKAMFEAAGFGANFAEPYKNIEQGTSTALRAALDPLLKNSTGAFLKDCNVWEGGPDYTRNPQLAERLWGLSEKIVGEQFSY